MAENEKIELVSQLVESNDCMNGIDEGVNFAGMDEVPVDPLIGKCIAERYQVTKLIGAGGTGRVYEVHHLLLHQRMAMKVLHTTFNLDKEKLLRFRQEAQTLHALNHPNIARVSDFIIGPDGQPCMIMELVEGMSVDQWLAQNGPASMADVIRIGIQICQGLGVAHRKGVIHRDIKSSNIILEHADPARAKVVDFGIATRLAEDHAQLTCTGMILGTPAYMSPEQCQGQKLDVRSDIYSVGCVLYELATGRRVFVGDSTFVIMNQHINASPSGFPEVNSQFKCGTDLERVILRSLAKQPGDRYQSIDEMEIDLKKIEGHEKISRKSPASKTQPVRSALFVTMTLLVALCVITVQFTRGVKRVSLEVIGPQAASVSTAVVSPSRVMEWHHKTLADFSKLIDANPTNSELYCERATLYHFRNEEANALTDFTKALELNPQFVEALCGRASTNQNLGRADEAIKDANQAIKLSPGYNSFITRGQIYSAVGMYDAAITDLQKAAQLNSQRAAPLTELGCVYDRIGLHHKAIEIITRAMTLAGSSPREFCDRGLFYIHTREFDNATQDLSHSMIANWATPYSYMALLQVSRGDLSGAEANATRAISLEPLPARGYRYRGEVNRWRGAYDKAIEDYGIAIAQDPGYAPCYERRAMVFMKLGQWRNALSDLQEGLRLNPHSASSWSQLAIVRYELADKAGSDLAILMAFAANPTAICYANRAALMLRRGETTPALADCRKALDMDPFLADAHQTYGDVLSSLHGSAQDIDKARAKAKELGYPGASGQLGF